MSYRSIISLMPKNSFDPDAQAVINAIEGTGVALSSIEKAACNTLITDFKNYGLWTKMKAIYGFLGGTAAAHKFNWKDPQDLDAAYRLQFNGGITHNSNGVIFSGVNSYANTFFTSNQFASENNFGMSTYNRLDIDSGGEIGVFSPDLRYIASRISSASYFGVGAIFIGAASTNSQGFWQLHRTSSSVVKAFKNTSVFVTGTIGAGSLNTRQLFIGALNNNGIANYNSSQNISFASINDGLSDSEASNFYTRVQAFQTSLSRQV